MVGDVEYWAGGQGEEVAIMDRSLKVAVGVMLILFLLPLVVGAIVVTGMAIPVYGIEPGIAGYILGWCGLVGVPSLFLCIVGVRLVRENIKEPRGGVK
jgi:hypothetical protein